jgi:GST-like protein
VIDLYGMTSPNVFKVTVMLEEAELDWRVHHIRIVDGDQFTPQFLEIGPNNKVPVIVDQDGPDGSPFSVFESGAILIYLAEKSGKFLSTDPARRSVTLQWLMFQMASVGPMFGQMNHFLRYRPPNSDYALDRYRSEVIRLMGVIERRLSEHPFLAGGDVSIADMALFPWMRTPLAYMPGFAGKSIDEAYASHPSIARWMTELQARPRFAAGLDKLEAALREKDLSSFSAASSDQLDRLLGRGDYARG